MIIKLPNKYTGKTIIDVLKKLTFLKNTLNEKWKWEEFVNEFQYILLEGEAVLTPLKIGITIFPIQLKEKKWIENKYLTFTLEYIFPEKEYSEIDINIKYIYNNSYGYDQCATNPLDDEFEDIRPKVEKVLNFFFNELTKKNIN